MKFFSNVEILLWTIGLAMLGNVAGWATLSAKNDQSIGFSFLLFVLWGGAIYLVNHYGMRLGQ